MFHELAFFVFQVDHMNRLRTRVSLIRKGLLTFFWFHRFSYIFLNNFTTCFLFSIFIDLSFLMAFYRISKTSFEIFQYMKIVSFLILITLCNICPIVFSQMMTLYLLLNIVFYDHILFWRILQLFLLFIAFVFGRVFFRVILIDVLNLMGISVWFNFNFYVWLF